MFSLASLPLIYVYSFSPKSELIGFVAFFVVNLIGIFFDMILDFISVFSQAQAQNATSSTKLSTIMVNLTWVAAVLFPSVNLKDALFNIRLKSNPGCISSLNSLFFTSYSTTGSWMSFSSPGLGASFVIFCGQIIFWWIILLLIENGTNIKLGCRRCCKCDQDLEQIADRNQWNNDDQILPAITRQRFKKLPSITSQRDDERLPPGTSQRDNNKLPAITRQRGKKLPPITSQRDNGETVPPIMSQRDDDEIIPPISVTCDDAVC